jgi:hypothetical protein
MTVKGVAMTRLLLALLFTALAWAQTSTTYTLPTTVCNASPENCSYEIANGDQSGLFQATTGYWMQFQYRAFPGQNPGYDAEYCNALGTWSAADTPELGSTAKLFTMDCDSHTMSTGLPSHMHAEIYAHSYVVTYICGGRVRTTCRATRWQVDSGSLAITR